MVKFSLHSLVGIFEASSLFFVLSFLLLSGAVLARSHVKENNCSSSCGQLNISSPFRLKGDPPYCGHRKYELVCDGNKAFLYIRSGNFSVLEISNSYLRIVDVGLASGICSHPLQSLSPQRSVEDDGYYLWYYSMISFVSCKTNNTSSSAAITYHPAACLNSNDAFVYVVSGYQVKDLKPTCSFLTMTAGDPDGDPDEDVFKLLKEGFFLSWSRNNLGFSYCLRDALRSAWDAIFHNSYDEEVKYVLLDIILFEPGLLYCVYESSNTIHFLIAVVLVVLLDLLVIVLLGRFIFAPLVVLVFLAHQFWKTLAPIGSIEKFLRNQQALSPTRYAYIDIIAMTSHFKEKLGQGGFGSVFRGELPGGHLVAIKMLSNSKFNGEDFISEVSTIGMIHHHNVVRLVGFCSDGSKRALVYEYMPNGSLDKHIFSSNESCRPFSSEKLNEIALGVARGIDYLHRGCDMRILHFDIKPHNILLDQSFIPKVSDFGLAKLYPKDYSIVSVSAARGTIGYIAPELISRNFGVISYKSDVYSFGMLLMDLAGGRRRTMNPGANSSSQIYYPSWIYDQLSQSEEIRIDNNFEIKEVERKLSIVGLWCIQIRPSDRPSMSQVVEMLEANVDTLQLPPKPFLSLQQKICTRQSSVNSSSKGLPIISEDSSESP